MISQSRNRGYNSNLSRKLLQIIIYSIILGVVMYFANYLITRPQQLSINASAGKAELYFNPSSGVITPPTSISLWVTTDKKVGFIAVELTFNATDLQLSTEPEFNNPALKRVIIKSSLSDANKSGKISLVAAVDRSTLSSAPVNSFRFATLKFTPKTKRADQSTSINIISSQLVDLNATPLSVSKQDSTFTLNPTTTPNSSVTPQPTTKESPTALPSDNSNARNFQNFSLNGGGQKDSGIIYSEGKILWIKYLKVKVDNSISVSSITLSHEKEDIKICKKKQSCTYYYLKLPSDTFNIETVVLPNPPAPNNIYSSYILQ